MKKIMFALLSFTSSLIAADFADSQAVVAAVKAMQAPVFAKYGGEKSMFRLALQAESPSTNGPVACDKYGDVKLQFTYSKDSRSECQYYSGQSYSGSSSAESVDYLEDLGGTFYMTVPESIAFIQRAKICTFTFTTAAVKLLTE